jgi:hypothetical protein
MKKANAHEAVIAEWSRWALQNLKGKQSGSARDADKFLAHLRENRPTFLMFRSQEGPEQTIRDWLREGGLVT